MIGLQAIMIVRKLIVLVALLVSAVCFSQGNNNRHPIRNILPINGDTIIAANWGKGIIITNDAGKSWSAIAPDLYFKSMTLDNAGVIWAIDSWVGIHEEDHSRIYKSTDKGKTWQETIFNTDKFFPLEIVSTPHQPLRISTHDKKEYLLIGKNPFTDWKYISVYKDMGEADAIIEGNYKFLKGKHQGKLLRRTVKWDTIYHFKDVYAYDLHIKKNTVYVAGFTGGVKGKAYFASLTNKKLHEYPIEGLHAYGIKEDNKGRLWIYTSEGINLLKTTGQLEKVY